MDRRAIEVRSRPQTGPLSQIAGEVRPVDEANFAGTLH